MPLPSSGPLSLNDIQTEFGGTNPIGMNEYYAGGGLVPAGTTGTFGAVPSSGALSIQNFYGTANYIPVYIEELFSTFLYNGASATQTIVNGINLSGNGGLLFAKGRSGTNSYPYWIDSARGVQFELASNFTAGQTNQSLVTSFNSNGFTLGPNNGATNLNRSGETYVSWTFREQPKFFDIVTFTTVSGAMTIPHNLGAVPGCWIMRAINEVDSWWVFHRSIPGQLLRLNGTSSVEPGFSTATSTNISISTGVYSPGTQIIIYLFAHDAGGFGLTGTDNVISCSGYAGNGGTQTITLGYEPQWIMIKCSSDARADGWIMVDNMRGMSNTGNRWLQANVANAETDESPRVIPTATGFTLSANASVNASGNTYIYIAIRRGPMKVPTTGTSVFAPALGTASPTIPTFVTNFPVDLGFYHSRANTADWWWSSRLQGGATLNSNTTFAEGAPDANYAFDSNTGWGRNFNSDRASSNFRRAPGYFDVVCYAGNSTARTLAHNLAAVPELITIKSRTDAFNWIVYSQPVGNTAALNLNSDITPVTSVWWNNTTPTSSVFTLGGTSANNAVGATFVAYLFASCPGVSRVGSFTGTGATQVINCGFTGGARFVLIKSTSTTGNWLVWDSARGIVAGNDPYLELNTTAAEVTGTDWVDTAATGFELSNSGGNLANSSGVSYIFLAIA